MNRSEKAGSSRSTRDIAPLSKRTMTLSVSVVTVAMRTCCPAKQPSPTKSPSPKMPTTASLPRSETIDNFTFPL